MEIEWDNGEAVDTIIYTLILLLPFLLLRSAIEREAE